MASGSEIETKEVVLTCEVGPREDVIQALMETLVDPLLPFTVSNVPPQENEQISVAKQMHAVVLLYNYYHRKQKPELKFLDFVSFCKLAMMLKPPLASFMKLMNESEPKNLDIANNDHLSITEKAIKGACDIALALDASVDLPIIEGWPISKVAVLLIDSKKENCMLRFGDVTKGVWSLIEKEVNEPKINPEMLLGEKIGDKRKRNSFKSVIYDKDFANLAYGVVKEITGIDSSDLRYLGAHVTYSLTQEKSTVRFYMMQCSSSFNVKEEVSLKFLVESLQGPLAEKLDNGFWKTTPVIEFYHMLPYVEFVSCWLSGEEIRLNSCKKELTETVTELDLPVPENNSNGLDKNISGPVSSSLIIATENHDETGKVKSLASHFQSTAKDGNDIDIDSEVKNKKSGVSFEVSNPDSEKIIIGDNVIEKCEKICGIVILNKNRDDCGLEKMNTDELTTKTCTKSDDTSNMNPSSKLRVYHHRKKNNSLAQNDAHVREDGDNLQVNKVDALTVHHAECGNETVVSEDKGDITISCDYLNIVASNVNQLVQFEDEKKRDSELQNASASEEVELALSLLYQRRQKLHSQICDMVDTLAYYENDIAKMRDGGDVGLAREYIKSIVSGSYHMMLEHGTRNRDDKGNNVKSQREKQTGLMEIYFPGKSSCQDLEYICLKNNWHLPNYLIEPSDGKFISDVFINGKDVELHSKGGYESRPYEARESAAAQMIAELRNLY